MKGFGGETGATAALNFPEHTREVRVISNGLTKNILLIEPGYKNKSRRSG